VIIAPRWESLTPDEAKGFERELQRELSAGHKLYGRQVEAIARAVDQDDVLYKLVGSEQVAEVHLTWASGPEQPPWPGTALYSSYLEWLAAAQAD
jgi:hypothetical protein